MELKELQKQFKSHLFSQESNIAQHIVSDQLSSEFRLSLYADGYIIRLIEVLENDYPALKCFLGEEPFYELCRQYIAQHPSIYPSLRWFGQHMPAYLKGADAFNQNTVLAELAELEWTLVDAFNAADQDCIEESDIAKIPGEYWPQLSFVFHPSVFAFTYQWNIIPLWQAYKDGQPFPQLQALSAPESCLVWRRELNTLFRTLEADEALLFSAATEGANFSQLCEVLSEQMGDDTDPQQVPLRAAGLLKTWISAALVTDINY